ncbi:MAG TPA: DUF58 domain-containing protein, partial [Kofleriaceae bacterium]|nr:DUF58 domain-containing protein [Kofleriaceae bacterium]
MRPTLRLVLVCVAGLPVSLGAALVSPRLWPAWLAYLVGVLLTAGVDALLALPRRRLAVKTAAPDVLYMGDADPLVIELEARGWRRPARLELLADLDADLEPVLAREVTVAPGAPLRVDLELRPRRRGVVQVDAVWLRWRGPFGLMQRTVRRPVGAAIDVVPNLRAVRAAALRFFSNRDFLSGLKVEHYLGDGSEFESLREYMPGLDHRAIDWKASARHNKLLCQEFRAERNHQVVITIDTGHLMSEPLGGVPRLDHAINAGLLLSYFCLRTGDRVGLYGFDDRVRLFAEPTGGMGAFPRLQRMTAELAYGGGETNFTVGLANLAARLRRRSLVVLLTEFVDVITAELMLDNLGRLAQKHLVVFVALRDPGIAALAAAEPRSTGDLHRAVVAGDFAREREAVLARLRRLGVHCIDAPPDRMSMNLLN